MGIALNFGRISTSVYPKVIKGGRVFPLPLELTTVIETAAIGDSFR